MNVIKKVLLIALVIAGIAGILLIMGFILSFFSSKTAPQDTCSHHWTEATCTDPKKCRICFKTSGAGGLGHTTEKGECSRCNKYIGKETWEIGSYVDEFNNPTGKKFISTTVDCEMKNAPNSKCEARLLVSYNSKVGIQIRQYDTLITGWRDIDLYKVKILDSNGIKHSLIGEIRLHDSVISFSEWAEQSILELLNSSDTLSFYLEYSHDKSTNYLFTIETSNFSYLYNKLTNSDY